MYRVELVAQLVDNCAAALSRDILSNTDALQELHGGIEGFLQQGACLRAQHKGKQRQHAVGGAANELLGGQRREVVHATKRLDQRLVAELPPAHSPLETRSVGENNIRTARRGLYNKRRRKSEGNGHALVE